MGDTLSTHTEGEGAPFIPLHLASQEVNSMPFFAETGSFLAETKRKDGAGKGIRTPDFNLGKVALYH